MNCLPPDLQIQILTFLPVSDIERSIKYVSKFHNGIVNEFKSVGKKSNFLWETLIKRDFPNFKKKEEWKTLPLHKIYHLLEKDFPELAENDENFLYEKRIYKFDLETSRKEAKLKSYGEIIDQKGLIFHQGQIYQFSEYNTDSKYYQYWHLYLKHIFTGEEVNFVFPPERLTELVYEIEPEFEKYLLIDIEEGYVTLMNEKGDSRSDLRLPRGKNGRNIQKRFENGDDLQVTVMKICGEEELYSVSKQNVQND